jgi:hypothetical protein
MGDVINLRGVTYLDLPVDRVLESAKSGLDGVVLIGWDKEGSFYFASTYADGGDVIWLIEKAKLALLSVGRPELE